MMIFLKPIFSFCLCIFASSTGFAAAVYAVKHATVLTMEKDRVLKNQTIIVDGQKITAIGLSTDIAVPKSATVLEARGKFVMPGLVDMHSHPSDPDELILNIVNGVTTIRVMWGDPNILNWREQILFNQLLGPLIFSTGPILDGLCPVQPGSIVLTDPDQAIAEVERQKYAGYDYIKIYHKLSKPVYQAIIQTANRVGLPVVGHLPENVGLKAAWAARQLTIEHWQGLLQYLRGKGGGENVDCNNTIYEGAQFDLSRIPNFIKDTTNSGVWNTPTEVVIQKISASIAAMEAWMASPQIQYVTPAVRAAWSMYLDKAKKSGNWNRESAPNRLLAQLSNELIGKLHASGGRLLIGTDAPNPFVFPGFAIHEELVNFQNAGIAPYKVLKIATLDAAEALGQSAAMGTVSIGKYANFLILDKDPRIDVRNVKSGLHGVMALGNWMDATALSAKLHQLVEKYKQQMQTANSTNSRINVGYRKIHLDD